LQDHQVLRDLQVLMDTMAILVDRVNQDLLVLLVLQVLRVLKVWMVRLVPQALLDSKDLQETFLQVFQVHRDLLVLTAVLDLKEQ
jgi:hypothetical protein